MKSENILLSILAGAATVAFAAILFAPRKGSATRRKISKTTRKYTGALSDTFNNSVGSIRKQLKKADRITGRLAENGKAKVEKIADDVEEWANAQAGL